MADTRIQKSSKDKMLAGVCGGLAEYFDIDPVLVRVAFFLLCFAGGLGLALYIVLAIIMPKEDTRASAPADVVLENLEDLGDQAAEASRRVSEAVAGPHRRESGQRAASSERRSRSFGLILIVLGCLFLLANLGVFWWFDWGTFWPLVLIVIGVLLLAGRFRRG